MTLLRKESNFLTQLKCNQYAQVENCKSRKSRFPRRGRKRFGAWDDGRIRNSHRPSPIISTLGEGRVEYTTQDGKQQFLIHGGFVEVKRNNVSLCIEQQMS